MSSAERLCCGTVALVAALLLPGVAFAHAGKRAPVATNFEAKIEGVRPAPRMIEASKVVDGDRGLWLRVAPTAVVTIPGAIGEPLLRFEPRGVFVNVRSLTARSDGIDRFDLRPDPNPNAAPRWHRLTPGHAYLWHEHRLHALEPLARGHRGSTLGNWSVPLIVDGRRHALHGSLVYRPPGAIWPWLILAGVLAAAQVLAPASSVTAARAAALLIWLVRVGRELYGRPSVSWAAELDIVFTSLVGVAFFAGLLHRDASVRMFTTFLLAFGCLYEAWTMFPVLTHAVALTVLPTRAVQAAVAAIIGLGAGMLVLTLREQIGARTEATT
ncbi:MAG: hypothetical protein ACTHKS_18575 [Gaiellaceae bacterium]